MRPLKLKAENSFEAAVVRIGLGFRVSGFRGLWMRVRGYGMGILGSIIWCGGLFDRSDRCREDQLSRPNSQVRGLRVNKASRKRFAGQLQRTGLRPKKCRRIGGPSICQ